MGKENILPFLRESGATAWRNLIAEVGSAEAERLAEKGRVAVMTALRIERHLTLQRVADIFGLTRERVRQLTPPGLWYEREIGEIGDDQVQAIFRKAAKTPEAWHSEKDGGGLRHQWLIGELGISEEQYKDISDNVFRQRYLKTEVLLKYGLHLQTEDRIKAWYQEQYVTLHRGFAELARIISTTTGVSISTMHVYRYFVNVLHCKVRDRGTYERYWEPNQG